MGEQAKVDLIRFWKWLRYLIVDEYSMIAKAFLALLSRNITIAKGQRPVGSSPSDRLYHPSSPKDTPLMQAGRQIYEEFDTVVVLKEQMRVTDAGWKDFLHRLRYGRNTHGDMEMLDTLVLVTPRHAVRRQWNEASLREHCARTGRRLFICPAEQTVPGGRALNLWERHELASHSGRGSRKRRGELPLEVEIAVGAQVLVTRNVETDLDITNGARGEIVGIVVAEDEPDFGTATVVRLQKQPRPVSCRLPRYRSLPSA
uniref:DNA helicase n=1 Tax=Schizophyllum commune (strain H4-8 / FGSC 9210) TaxID=578458 RepID=D8PLN3_SCHCM